MKLIHKPTDNYPSYYQVYLDTVPDDGNLLKHLQIIIEETERLVLPLCENQLKYRYAEGKWTIKDILVHLSDCERTFLFRLTKIARGDKDDLSSFDGNLFVQNAKANSRDIKDIILELRLFRNASIAFIESLDEEALNRTGMSQGNIVSARYLANHIYGHHKHHLNTIEERYFQ